MFSKIKNAYVTIAAIGAIISFVYSIFFLIRLACIKAHSTNKDSANLPADDKIPQEEKSDDEMLKKNGWDYV